MAAGAALAHLAATTLVLHGTLALIVPMYFILRDLVGEGIGFVQFIQNGAAEKLAASCAFE